MTTDLQSWISVKGASEHNLRDLDVRIPRNAITVVTGVSGSGKSSLAFDTILAEANRRFFYTLSHYSRQFLDLGNRPAVRSVSGLSPAIGLAQRETSPSTRSTVGSLTDLNELLGVMFARFAERLCPDHMRPVAASTPAEMSRHVLARAAGKMIAIGPVIAEKQKGHFRRQLESMAAAGYTRALIDGALMPLNPLPELDREKKHDISIVVDILRVKETSMDRLTRSMEAALELGEGYAGYSEIDASKAPVGQPVRLSAKEGCPDCGFSWPVLSSRHFSANSLGACPDCKGRGSYRSAADEDVADEGMLDEQDNSCGLCQGTGLDPRLDGLRLSGRSIGELQRSSLAELQDFFSGLSAGLVAPDREEVFDRVCQEILANLARAHRVGLQYLWPSRRVRSLSAGEAQRLRLAGVLGENLRGVLYVLDEPSQGLHESEIAGIRAALENLKKLGNTIIIVDHDESFIRYADWIIDLGPGGGQDGGRLMAAFPPEQAADWQKYSVTARYLCAGDNPSGGAARPAELPARGPALVIEGPRLHNLRCDKVRIPLGAMTTVTGVSGAGKTSLIRGVLYENLRLALETGKEPGRYCDGIQGWQDLTRITMVDRKPLAKSSVSMPATWLDLFTPIRQLFAKLPDAQIQGYAARDFSIAVSGGRCEECSGRGYIALSMKFLADARGVCPVCEGRRYQPAIRAIRYAGLSLDEVLDLTLDEAREQFGHFPALKKKLDPACALGLGYLKLGQPAASLSGGEAQRLKLVPFLAKKVEPGQVIVLDEPTAGLHFADVDRLLQRLRELVDQGVTLILIEHNREVMAASEWVIRLGPGPARAGGRLVYAGSPGADPGPKP